MRIRVRKKTREQHSVRPTVMNDLGDIAQPLSRSVDGIESDVLGSYTGTAADGTAPEQDADDL